jgi:hypothetical protein
MSKISEYKESKKKSSKVEITRADGGFIVHTHYPGPIDGSTHGTLIDNEGPEKSVHKNLASIHRHLNNKMGGKEEKE